MLSGRTPERGSGHAIVAGAGNIGFRVAGLLAASGKRLVVIEREAHSRNAAELSAAGHHVILADATSEETLELSGLCSATVVLALTDSDAVNLQVALRARHCGVPVVMRADSAELAEHVAARGDAVALSPVAAATRAFCDAAVAVARSDEGLPLRA
jgi:Trk K+ transport system NAD-binding subunit